MSPTLARVLSLEGACSLGMTIAGLLIQLTRRCPIECNHCYVTASPHERATLSNDLLIRAIQEYAAFPDATKAVCFTGGEPFAVIPLLVTGVLCARHLGFFIHINTSAFFARSLATSLKILQRVEGLSQLEVSVDREHQRFVPLENVQNALRAAQLLQIPAQLAIQAEDRDSATVLELLEKFPDATLYVQNFAPVGTRNTRADDHPDLMPRESRGGCAKVGSIFVDEEGYVFPCTSAVVSSHARENEIQETFALGNLSEHPFDTLLGKLNSLRLRSIRCMGPSAVRRFVEDGASSQRFRSYCDECLYLATSGIVDNQPLHSKGELLEWAMRQSPNLV